MSGGIVPDAAAGPALPDRRFRRGRAAARQKKTDRLRCSTAVAVDTDRTGASGAYREPGTPCTAHLSETLDSATAVTAAV
jgi:hypothetical protein